MNKILLLSIRPQYSEKIFSGEKSTELRRLRPAVEAGDLVLVYTSAPSCEMTGAFLVRAVDDGTPETLWQTVRNSCGLTRQQYDDYFRGSKKAYAIGIERAWRLESPFKLAHIRNRSVQFHPPQSYRYLDPTDLSILFPAVTARGLLPRKRRSMRPRPTTVAG